MFGGKPVADRDRSRADPPGDIGRQADRVRRRPKGVSTAVEVQHDDRRIVPRRLDRDDWYAAEFTWRRRDVVGKRHRSDHLVKDHPLFVDVATDVELAVPQNLVKLLALLPAHRAVSFWLSVSPNGISAMTGMIRSVLS